MVIKMRHIFFMLIALSSCFYEQKSLAVHPFFNTGKFVYTVLKNPSSLNDKKTKDHLWNSFKNIAKTTTAFAQSIAISTAMSRASIPHYPLARYFYFVLRQPTLLKNKENQNIIYKAFKLELETISILAKYAAKTTAVSLGVNSALTYPITSTATACCYFINHFANKIPYTRLSSLLLKHKYHLVSGSAAIGQLILATKISALILKQQPNFSPFAMLTSLYFLNRYAQTLKNLLPQLEASFPESKMMSCFKHLNPFRQPDAYTILGINQNATPEEIRKAYQKSLHECHPDKNPNNTQGAAQRLKEIQEAYKFLYQHRSTHSSDSFWKRLTKNWRRFTHEQTQEPDMASSESIKLLTWQPRA